MKDRAHVLGCYRGRRWLAAFLVVCSVALLIISGATLFLDDAWLAFLTMGLPALLSAYVCLVIAFGEAVARIELRTNGFSIRLPNYRGYLPHWPALHLHAQWKDVTQLISLTVHARVLFLRYDYVLHRIIAGERAIVLFEPRPGVFRNVRGAGLNLPASQIAACIARQTGLESRDEGEVDGGGLWRNLIKGSNDGRWRPEPEFQLTSRQRSESSEGQ